MNKPKYHIFVCSSSRLNGQMKGMCCSKNSVDIINTCVDEIQERGLEGEVLVTNTGCLAVCSQGPIVIVYPDAVWYGSVTPDDVSEIMDSHIENGEPVKRLEI